jgi:hypothetical protein
MPATLGAYSKNISVEQPSSSLWEEDVALSGSLFACLEGYVVAWDLAHWQKTSASMQAAAAAETATTTTTSVATTGQASSRTLEPPNWT